MVADPLDRGWLVIITLAFGLLRTLRSKVILRLRARKARKVMKVNESREARESVRVIDLFDRVLLIEQMNLDYFSRGNRTTHRLTFCSILLL